jgi:DNA-binding NarL/FixJ family response regulator
MAQRDLHALSKFIREVYLPRDSDAWVDNTLSSIQDLIPCHLVTYREGPISNPPRRAQPAGIYTGESGNTYERLIERQPKFVQFARDTERASARLSDFLSRGEFHRSALYDEVYRPARIEDVLAVAFVTRRGELRGIGLHRDQLFAERDRLLLDIVRPHLYQAYENAKTFTQLKRWAAGLEQGLAAFSGGVIELTADRRIANSTANIRRLLAEYFGGSSACDRLPETLDLWLRQHDQRLRDALQLPPPLTPLIAGRPGTRLLVRMLADSDSPTLLLDEQPVSMEPNRFRSLGLTERENQVLASVARGLTNKRIASELSISPRTVQPHLEHIYGRLGVKTRTAAAALAFRADYPC